MADSFENAWREYKRLRNALLLIYLGGVPLVALFGFLGRKLFHTEWLFPLGSMFWFVLCILYFIKLRFWECPRCRKPFYIHIGTHWYRNGFLNIGICRNCGMPKYAMHADPGKW